MSAAGNAADAVLVARHLGTKMIAKSTAKKVAVGVVTGSAQHSKQSTEDACTQLHDSAIRYPEVQKPHGSSAV